MATLETNSSGGSLFLDEIGIETASAIKHSIVLRNGDTVVNLQAKDVNTWTPSPSLELSDTLDLVLTVMSDRKRDLFSLHKPEAKIEVVGQTIMKTLWDDKTSLSVGTTFHDHPLTATFKLRSSKIADITRASVKDLEEAMKNYHTLMSERVQEGLEKVFAVVEHFSEANSFTKTAFGIVTKTFDLLKEQQKYDAMIPGLAEKVEGILPFADAAVGDIIRAGDTDLLEDAADKMYKLVEETAVFVCEYVKQGAWHRAAKSLISSESRKKIEELEGEFDKLKENFDRAVNVQALRQARSIENRIILERLKPAGSAGYDEAHKCMEGTRTVVLNEIIDWTTEPVKPDDSKKLENIYWVHGSPGLGKTALSTSLCMRLHENKRLGGSFFCRRDDSVLCQPKYILPALIYQLAGMWVPYGKAIVQALRDDSQLSPETSNQLLSDLLLGPLGSLQKVPPYPLVVVVDALDESGDDTTRKELLNNLGQVMSTAPWLKIIVTSRPEQEIQYFFKSLDDTGGYVARDLAQVQATEDLRFFVQNHMSAIAIRYHLSDWPGDAKLDEIATRAEGLFMYAETVCRFVKSKTDPKKALDQILGEKSETASQGLDQLYQRAIELVVEKDELDLFRKVVGAIIVTSNYRPLSGDALATLLGLEPYVVKVLVDKLSSLLRQDGDGDVDGTGGGIRVRHLSIAEFLTKETTSLDFRVDLKAMNTELGAACLNTMIKELKFNICQLETSSRLNSQVDDLKGRINQHISDSLQYSCMHWSSHVCAGNDPSDDLKNLLEKFLGGEKLLYWLEVLSLLGQVHLALSSLRQLKLWIKNTQDRCYELAADAIRFVTAYYTAISTSAPHIYLSGLSFSPKGSLVRKNNEKFFQNLLVVSEGHLESWPAASQAWDGHTDCIQSLAFSPDGLRVVSGSGANDKTLRIWDAETGEAIGEPLTGHTDRITKVVYSLDGNQIYSGSFDGTLRVWDSQTGLQIGQPLVQQSSAICFAYSTDGTEILTGCMSDETVMVWNAQTRELKGQYKLESGLLTMAFSPDGKSAATGGFGSNVCIWNDTPLVLTGHEREINRVCYSPNGRHIASGSGDSTVRIWDAQKGSLICDPLTGHTGEVLDLAYSPDGLRIVSASMDGTLRLWDAQTGELIGQPIDAGSYGCMSVAFSPDGPNGQKIICGLWDKSIKVFDARTGKPFGHTAIGHTRDVTAVTFSPYDDQIVSGSLDNTIRRWNAQTGEPLGEPLTGHTSEIIYLAYSEDGKQILSGSEDGTERTWDAQTGEPVGEPVSKTFYGCGPTASAPDGTQNAYAPGAPKFDILVRGGETDIEQPLVGHTDYVLCLSYSSDSRRLVSGSRDKTIRVWDVENILAGCMNVSTGAGADLELKMDETGWVRHQDELIFWAPVDYRNGLICPALFVIPNDGRFRRVRVDISQMRYGNAWTEVQTVRE